jgi:hypothetical protein
MSLLRVTAYIGLFIGLTGCNENGKQPAPKLWPSKDSQVLAPEKEIAVTPMSLTDQIKFSKKDLALRLDIELDLITLSEAQQVNWRSGALGCPQPGMSYIQVLMPGVLIFLNIGKELHAYHAKRGGKPFYCHRARAKQPEYGQDIDMT